MADTTAPASLERVTLQANSYDFGKLHTAALKAEKVKASERDAAIASLARDQALNQDVIAGAESVAVPEGTALAHVEDAQGRKVVAAVMFCDEDQRQKAIDTFARKDGVRAEAPPATSTDTTAA